MCGTKHTPTPLVYTLNQVIIVHPSARMLFGILKSKLPNSTVGISHLARDLDLEKQHTLRHEEKELLLRSASAHCKLESGAGQTNNLALSHLDWKWVLQQAGHHAIEPLLQAALSRYQSEEVPEAVQMYLASRSRAIAMRNMQQARELVRICSHIETEGCPVIPLKGPVIGQVAYGNLAFRQSLDLDLLVRHEDFGEATSALHRLGYESLRALDASEKRDFIEWHASYEFVHPEQRIIVELHHDLFKGIHAPVLDLEHIWERHTQFPFAGSKLRGFALDDLVLYLCAHGTKHRWAKLKWIADIAGIIHHRSDIDWQTVHSRAARIGSLRMVHLGLGLAHALLGVPSPKPFKELDKCDMTVQNMAVTVRGGWLFVPPDTPVDPWTEFWFHLRERERWRDRVGYVQHSLRLAVIPTEKDRGFVRLPSWLSWLYVLVRPLRVVVDIIRGKYGTRRVSPRS